MVRIPIRMALSSVKRKRSSEAQAGQLGLGWLPRVDRHSSRRDRYYAISIEGVTLRIGVSVAVMPHDADLVVDSARLLLQVNSVIASAIRTPWRVVFENHLSRMPVAVEQRQPSLHGSRSGGWSHIGV